MLVRLDRRSMLCTPATSTDRFPVARDCGADVALVDLEDSVASERKAAARSQAERYFLPPAVAGSAQPAAAAAPAARSAAGEAAPSGVLALRINSPGTLDGLRDLVAVAGWAHRPSIVLVPKVESGRDVEVTAAAVDTAGSRAELYAVIETPRGIVELPAITRSPRLDGVVFGAADYALETGTLHAGGLSWEGLLFARSAIVAAAAAAGLPAIDSPSFDLDDRDGLARDAERARALGFCGKVAIHPRQVAVLNAVFAPSAAELARAQKIAAAGRGSGKDVTATDGLMVGTPFFVSAAALLAEVDRVRVGAGGATPAVPANLTRLR